MNEESKLDIFLDLVRAISKYLSYLLFLFNFVPLIIKPEIVIMLFKCKEEKFVEKSRDQWGGEAQVLLI